MAIIDRFKLNKKTKAQTLVEFALVMPLLMLVIVGLLEVGRLIFMHSIVISAAREGARYGSATGTIGGTTQYKDCDAIRAAAERVDPLGIVSISIHYDRGPGTSQTGPCPNTAGYKGDGLDRIVVQASASYVPFAGLVPLTAKNIVSTNERTLLGQVKLPADPLPPPDQFSLYVDVVGVGKVNSNPVGIDNCTSSCSFVYDKDTVVHLTAEKISPTSTSEFQEWNGACTGSDPNNCLVTLSAARSVTAIFHSTVQHTLTIVMEGTGISLMNSLVTSVPNGISCVSDTCSADFDEGQDVYLTASVTGYSNKFDGWSGGGCVTNNPCKVTLMTDTTVHATFTYMPDQQLALTVFGDGMGEVTSNPAGIDCIMGSSGPTGTCVAMYPYGRELSLTAVPTGSDLFGGWGGDCTGTNPVCSPITMNGAKSITAEFKKRVCDIKHSGPLPRIDKYRYAWTIYNNTPNVEIGTVTISWENSDLISAILSNGFTYNPSNGNPPQTFVPNIVSLSKGTHDLTLEFSIPWKASNVTATMTFTDPVCKDLVLFSNNLSQVGP